MGSDGQILSPFTNISDIFQKNKDKNIKRDNNQVTQKASLITNINIFKRELI